MWRLGWTDFAGGSGVVCEGGNNSSRFVCFYCTGLIRGGHSRVIGTGLLLLLLLLLLVVVLVVVVMVAVLLLLMHHLPDVHIPLGLLNPTLEVELALSLLPSRGDGVFEF